MTSVGDYDLDEQIGAGASGGVWRAHSRGPVARAVALKRLRAGGDRRDLERMRREAVVLTELDHPHVVRVLEVLQDGDGLALAMQLAPGGSLADLLAERGRLAPGEVVAVAAPVADALASAHRRGVLHGDVKPANVLFTSDGEPLLSDFGVARSLGPVTSEQVSGTPEYVAPELLDGSRPDPAADIYSLGVVCYQALVGQPPYTGLPLAVLRAADAGSHLRLDSLGHVPEPLALVVEWALERDPAQRVASADELARVLRASVPADEIRLPDTATQTGRSYAAYDRTATTRTDGDAGATRTFGPRPPRPEPPPARRRRSRRMPVLAAAGLGAAGLVYLVGGPLSSGDDDGEGPASGADACPDVEAPGAGADALVVEGDPEGDGCAATGIYGPETVDGAERMVLSIDIDGARQRIALGEPGDQVVLGDWNCDGADTPGLYRAAAGEVQYFDAWPQVEQRRYGPDATEPVAAGGTASLAEGRDGGCDRIQVASSR
ncbi:MAG TPA: serine/threonine-protein kinase, partial [Acidimicrobiales bacterium]|nr:serine/threonine-protein kinase [Acidimicrobiales bacterium]